MAQITAILNAGRWLVYCPKHGRDGAVLAEPLPDISPLFCEGGEYVCPECYPGMKAYGPHIVKGKIVKRFDMGARAAARLAAREVGEIYQVVFPENRTEIEEVVAKRPELNRNWEPGETLEMLKHENLFYAHAMEE